jgi:hypothetical protein
MSHARLKVPAGDTEARVLAMVLEMISVTLNQIGLVTILML